MQQAPMKSQKGPWQVVTDRPLGASRRAPKKCVLGPSERPSGYSPGLFWGHNALVRQFFFRSRFQNQTAANTKKNLGDILKTKLNNLNIIANYLFNNPGARYTELTRHLCEQKNKAWGPGQYCRYFTRPIYYTRSAPQYAHHLWSKTPCGGWMLTLEGYAYVKL
jgi:hypothetical protein